MNAASASGSIRVAGCDPGTGSLDALLLEGGAVRDQRRFEPEELAADPRALPRLLEAWRPLDLVYGPSGYGAPLKRAEDLSDEDVELMVLSRPEGRGRGEGVAGFRGVVRALRESGLPVVFGPGGVHLPTIPARRKANGVDFGTADKVATAALAVALESKPNERTEGRGSDRASSFSFSFSGIVVEVGTAFTSALVLEGGALVDAAAGSRGPLGWRSPGAWDGEAAHWLWPIEKGDLFRGGAERLGAEGALALRESVVRHVGGLRALHPGASEIRLCGRGLERDGLGEDLASDLERLGTVRMLGNLPGARVKHAAQGAALLADGLAGGRWAGLVDAMRLRDASGTALDHLPRPPIPPIGKVDGAGS